MIQFDAAVLIMPGLGNSGDHHWQTLWENKFGFQRVQQDNWDTPVKTEWLARVDDYVKKSDAKKVVLVGHSLACSSIVSWAEKYQGNIKGALLVAPSDTEADSYPPGTIGFDPMPLFKLPFPSIVVASADDPYVTLNRARHFSTAWGSHLEMIGDAGHINVASGHGEWNEGLDFLKRLTR
jgi:uncharacterized protein